MDKKNETPQNDEVRILNHNYDNIQEYDNPLPGWWLVTFFATIIFSFNYFIHYTWGGGQTQTQELAQHLDSLPKSQQKSWQEQDLIAQLTAEEVKMNGKMVYSAKCSSCHGQEGQGMIGPNLTDRFWIHGQGLRKDIIEVIAKGVVEKGMPAWDGMISENELLAVTGYVYSLQGQNPPNPKEPQGQEITN